MFKLTSAAMLPTLTVSQVLGQLLEIRPHSLAVKRELTRSAPYLSFPGWTTTGHMTIFTNQTLRKASYLLRDDTPLKALCPEVRLNFAFDQMASVWTISHQQFIAYRWLPWRRQRDDRPRISKYNVCRTCWPVCLNHKVYDWPSTLRFREHMGKDTLCFPQTTSYQNIL